jgi:hypothetical protein
VALIPSAGADLRRLIAAARARGTVPSESLEDLAQAAEGSLAVLLDEARRTGTVYTGLYLGWEPDGRQTEARLLVVIRPFGPSADPIDLLRALRAHVAPPPRVDEREVGLVQYDETVVVRRAGLVESEQGPPLLHHEYYFPVPHDEERLALLDFSSPTITAAPRLGDMFASMAASFHFTEA